MPQPVSTLQDYLFDLLRTPKSVFNAALEQVRLRLDALDSLVAKMPGGRALEQSTVTDADWVPSLDKGALQLVTLTAVTHTLRLPTAASAGYGASFAFQVTPTGSNCALVVGPGIKNLTPTATATPLQKDNRYLVRLTVFGDKGFVEVMG